MIRGVELLEFPNFKNLEVLDQGDNPIFGSAGRLDVIDVTQAAFGHLISFKRSDVSSEPS
jgi:hypothetical protein